MTELEVLYLNIFLYATAFVLLKMKYGFMNLSTVCIAFYFFGSIASLLFFLTPIYNITFSNEGKMNVGGMLWLFLFNFLLCYLLRFFTFPKVDSIVSYNKRFMDKFQSLLIFVYIIILIFDLPVSLQNLVSGNLSDLRDMTYTEGGHESKFFFVDMLKRVFGEANIVLLATALFNILVVKRKRKIDTYSIIIYFLMLLNTMAAYVSRSVIVYRLIGIVVLLIVLKQFIRIKIIKNVFIVGLPVLLFLSYFFNSVTSSRFGDSTQNSQAELFANLRYAGEPQINFIGLMYDKTDGFAWGYRSLPLFRKLIGLEYFGQAGADKEKNLIFLDKLHRHPNFILYTAAGDWYLDIGRYLPMVILLLLNYLVYSNRKQSRYFHFVNFIVAVVVGYYAINGIFYSQYQSESGNFVLIFMFLIYYKNRNYSYSLSEPSAHSFRRFGRPRLPTVLVKDTLDGKIVRE